MRNASQDGPDPIDVQVGLRIRARRKALGVSQSQLADGLGITFQQIQKYERGTNRISASMLVKAARVLQVAPTALLPDEDAPTTTPMAVLRLVGTTRGAEDLVSNFARIPSDRLRRALLFYMRVLASESQKGVFDS